MELVNTNNSSAKLSAIFIFAITLSLPMWMMNYVNYKNYGVVMPNMLPPTENYYPLPEEQHGNIMDLDLDVVACRPVSYEI